MLFLIHREEGDGVHNSLAIVENIVEFRPAVCKDAAQAGLLAWLVKKLKVKVPFDANKLYASEILSILLQNEPENRFGQFCTRYLSDMRHKSHNELSCFVLFTRGSCETEPFLACIFSAAYFA